MAALEVLAAAAHEVVEHDDLGHRFGDQAVGDVRADQAGAAGDQHATVGEFQRCHFKTPASSAVGRPSARAGSRRSPNHARGHARDDRERRHVVGHDRAGADDGCLGRP